MTSPKTVKISVSSAGKEGHPPANVAGTYKQIDGKWYYSISEKLPNSYSEGTLQSLINKLREYPPSLNYEICDPYYYGDFSFEISGEVEATAEQIHWVEWQISFNADKAAQSKIKKAESAKKSAEKALLAAQKAHDKALADAVALLKKYPEALDQIK